MFYDEKYFLLREGPTWIPVSNNIGCILIFSFVSYFLV